METPTRMTWKATDRYPVQESGCGRFEVGGALWRGPTCYVRLFDRRTGREHPCRTVESAKAAARALLED